MSLEGLIKSLHRTNAGPSDFRKLRASWMLEEEGELYEFAKRHITRHRVLPTPETLRAAGFRLNTRRDEGEEPPAYYLERIRVRAAFNAVNNLHAEYMEGMNERDMPRVLRSLRQMASAGGESLSSEACTTLAATAGLVLEDFEDARLHPGLRGATLAWPTLNALTLGIQPEDFMIIAGRPGDGKTQILLEIAFHQMLEGKSVLVVSMEMGILQLIRRVIARRAALNPNWIRGGELSHWGEERLRSAIAEMQTMGERFFVLQGDFRKDVAGIVDLARENNPDVVLIDGAYLLTEEGRAKGHVSKWEVVSGVSNAIKRDLCLGLGKPTIATFQFNRNVRRATNRTRRNDDGEQEPRDEREPDLNDVAGSDSAPQDASLVLSARRGRAPYAKTRRRLGLIKNREGEEGEFEIHFRFDPPCFDEVVETEPEALSNDWMIA